MKATVLNEIMVSGKFYFMDGRIYTICPHCDNLLVFAPTVYSHPHGEYLIIERPLKHPNE